MPSSPQALGAPASLPAAGDEVPRVSAELYELVAVHSLTWLFVVNAVGLLLATLLLFPGLGGFLGPLTYGRWVPVHLDLALYGWCSLPLVGLLFRLYLPASPGRMPRLALGLWSGTLLFGALSWLTGHSGGKLFLEWSGAARALLLLNLAFLAVTLLAGFLRQTPQPKAIAAAKGLFLLALLAVPFVLYWAASPKVYPPINPDSGGATGASLMGSTLGIIALLVACPFVLGMRPDDGGRATRLSVAVLALHLGWFAVLGHGDRSHHEIVQVVSLCSLGIWLPLLTRHLRRFPWTVASRRWLAALCGWGVLLFATGATAFLPGVLESWKFTHALVAHAHVAMAGLSTSLVVLILIALAQNGSLRDLFAATTPFVLWHGGTVVHMAALLTLGVVEASNPGILFRDSATVTVLYAIRWIGGALMLTATGQWLWMAAGSVEHVREPALVEVHAACES